jgi:hypothetical protein
LVTELLSQALGIEFIGAAFFRNVIVRFYHFWIRLVILDRFLLWLRWQWETRFLHALGVTLVHISVHRLHLLSTPWSLGGRWVYLLFCRVSERVGPVDWATFVFVFLAVVWLLLLHMWRLRLVPRVFNGRPLNPCYLVWRQGFWELRWQPLR